MGLSADSFQSVRFSHPNRLLDVDRLMAIADSLGAAGVHGGMTQIDLDWAQRTRRMKDDLDMYLEIQTFLPREDPAAWPVAMQLPMLLPAEAATCVAEMQRPAKSS